MAVEVERKFLIGSDQWRQSVLSQCQLRQGYLASSNRCLVRVRWSEAAGWVTIKGLTSLTDHGALRRPEYEWQIDPESARELIDTCAYATVEKTRYHLDRQPGEWTVDVFCGENAGLVLLEIEGDAAAQLRDHDLPDWVGQEVSADPRYANVYLAKHPYTGW